MVTEKPRTQETQLENSVYIELHECGNRCNYYNPVGRSRVAAGS